MPTRKPFARAASFVLGAVASIAACSSSSDSGGGGGGGPDASTGAAHPALTLDAIETQLLAGLDQPMLVSQEQLDQDFPVVERMTKLEYPDERDPTRGDIIELEKTFDAFAPTESADDHFTIDKTDTGVTPAVIERVKKGVLFGIANRDDFVHGFSLTAATSKKAGGTPFFVSILSTPDPELGYRSSVQPCGGGTVDPVTVEELLADVENDTCIPRLVLRAQNPWPGSFGANLFVHELSHVAQDYWAQSRAYLDAGGMKLAGAYHKGFSWQFESDAQFTERHSPWGGAYGLGRCAFEPLRVGAFAWKTFSATGADPNKPYQMAHVVDQVTWHRYKSDPSWIYQWLVAKVDPRTATAAVKAPNSPARRLLELISDDPARVNLSSLNLFLLQAGIDLYARGRDPWTSKSLSSQCVLASASVDLPLFAFDSILVDPGDLTKAARLHLALDASRDPTFVRALVAAADRTPSGSIAFADCAEALPDSALGTAEPRAACAKYLHPLTALHEGNGWKDDVLLDATFAVPARYAIVAVVFHLPLRADAQRAPITVTLRATPVATPPGTALSTSECPSLTNTYRARCKTSDCYCIGNAYCEGALDPPPTSCELFQRDCYLFCAFQKPECDCSSFCDLLRARMGCP